MSKNLLENYIKRLNEQEDEPFPEGTLMNKIFVGLGFGFPRHKKFQACTRQYGSCVETCQNRYEEERQTYKSERDMFNQMDDPDQIDQRSAKQTETMSNEMVKNNPDKAKCITQCRIVLLRSIIDLMEREGDRVCEKNIFTGTCKEWINKNIPDMKAELEYLESTVEKIDKTNDTKKIQRVLSKVNSNMIRGK